MRGFFIQKQNNGARPFRLEFRHTCSTAALPRCEDADCKICMSQDDNLVQNPNFLRDSYYMLNDKGSGTKITDRSGVSLSIALVSC